ncbi:MAG: response regulator [Campylobacterota bacterium]|nr:response regulator [Campylobacterota bacterium]
MHKIVITIILGLSVLLYGSANSDQAAAVDQTIWIALFVLGIVGVIILFVSSRQLANTKSLHDDMVKRQLEMEQGQTSLLTNMSENIFMITKEAIESRDKILENSKERSLEQVLEQVIKAENTLLDRTHDLIDFLRLKSKKIEINNESFNLNNVLNEVAGSVCANYKGSSVELIFDIDNNVPKFFIGDSLQLGQIFNNLLDYSFSRTIQGEIKLDISIFQTFEDKTQLQFQIFDTSEGLDAEGLEKLFIPYYDEELKEYVGLGLFVAQQLVELMGGEITVQSLSGKGTTFTFVLPLKINNKDNRRNYRLPEKVLTTKKVFIVDKNYNSALAIKKMFAYFKHDVTVVSKEQFALKKPGWEEYDIIVLCEDLLTTQVAEYLKVLKTKKDLKVVGVSSLLRDNKNILIKSVAERQLIKPLNQERVFELIIDLYRIDMDQVLQEEKREAESEIPDQESKIVQTHREPIPEAKNIVREQFADFSGAKLLIVEDNLINQKVLTTILDKSGIEITIAGNGEEALMLVTSGKIVFDLVLMDINMPVMDGYTATEYIRATGKFDDLPIVSFTALVLDSEVEKMFNAGINAFLSKPLNVGKLYTAFDMFIGAKPARKSIDTHKKQITKKIVGIDINEGIRYANGDEALYMEVLKEFVEYYGETGKLFKKLVKENRFEQIKMLCLDMKGLTGSIGAHDMHVKVDEVYKLFIYGNQSLLPKYSEGYEKELDKLIEAINIYLNGNTDYSV